MARADPKFMLRLPAEMKAWVQVQAKRNGASLNSEIVRSIRERMDRMTGAFEAPNKKSDDGQSLAAPVVALEINPDGDR